MSDPEASRTEAQDAAAEAPSSARASELQFRAAVENAMESVLIAQDGEVVYVNAAGTHLLGRPAHEIIASPFVRFIHPEDQRMVHDHHVRRLRGEPMPERYFFRVIDAGGSAKWVEIKPLVTVWQGRPATMSFLRDISRERGIEAEKQQLEERLHGAQRLESLGMLAGGVAHEINNVLAAVMGFASDLERDPAIMGEHHEAARSILAASRRGRELCTNLLGLARKGHYRLERFDLTSVAEDVAMMVDRTASKRVTVRVEIVAEPLIVEGDPTQLTHALLNLCLNGVDAMASGGLLLLRARRILLDQLGGALPAGEYAAVDVIDSGTGMDAATLARAFDPLFTTKPPGHGTGLGVSMALGAAQTHGGTVTLESSVGSGTTATVYIPLARSADKVPSTRPRGDATHQGSGTILIVDDEPLVRNATARLLRRLGYEVIPAGDGLAAIAALRGATTKLAAVVLDVLMPGMDGVQTCHELRSIDPTLRVVFASGFADEGRMREALTLPGTSFLPKPFDVDELADALRAATEGGDPTAGALPRSS